MRYNLDEVIKKHIEKTYFVACEQNVTKTSEALGISRATLYRYLTKHGIGRHGDKQKLDNRVAYPAKY